MKEREFARPTPCPTLWLACVILALQAADLPAQQNPSRWEEAIAKYEMQDRESPPPAAGIVFVGSSSIRLWDLKKSFPDLPVINRGFGGSGIGDSVRFADRIVLPYRPRIVVVYAGDNDLARGLTPEQVSHDFEQLVHKIHAALPQTRVIFIGIKPSLARWKLVAEGRTANKLVADFAQQHDHITFLDVGPAMLGEDGMPRKELFVQDGLHLNAQGYQVWSDLLRPHLKLE